MSLTLSMSHRCSGCRNTIKDDSDMLVELDGTCVHVDHLTFIGVRMRTHFYGPYCSRECWTLDARPGETFTDAGRFTLDGSRA